MNSQISKMQVHKFILNHEAECRTPFTLDMHYRLIPPRSINVVTPSIPSKPRSCARFG